MDHHKGRYEKATSLLLKALLSLPKTCWNIVRRVENINYLKISNLYISQMEGDNGEEMEVWYTFL